MVSPTCLPWPTEPIKVQDQDRGMVLGWGRTSNDRRLALQVSLYYKSKFSVPCIVASFQNQQKFQAAIGMLQAVSLPTVDDEICAEVFPLKDNFCAGGEEGKLCT